MLYVASPRHLARTLRAFDAACATALTQEEPARSPALDLSEDDTSYTVELDMPGVSKSEVKVTVEGRRINIEAAPSHASPETQWLHRERRAARYARSFLLPKEVNQDSSEARFENGVLTLKLAKRQPTGGSLTIN